MNKYINLYDDLSDYSEDIRPSDGSTVNLIGTTDLVYEGKNIFVETPDYADAVFYDSNYKVCFVRKGTIDLNQLTDQGYNAIGVVAKRYGNGEVLVVHKDVVLNRWAAVPRYRISGSALVDNIEHSCSVKLSSGSAANTATSSIFTWQTSTVEEFATALNTLVRTEGNYPPKTYFSCYVDPDYGDDCVMIQQDVSASTGLASNKSIEISNLAPGMSVTYAIGEEIPNTPNVLLTDGRVTVYNVAAMCLPVTAATLSFDAQPSSSYNRNPTSSLEALTTLNPICLPAYLGTSQWKSQWVDPDPCEGLRAIYGDGRDGWLNYLQNRQMFKKPCFNYVNGGYYAVGDKVYAADDGYTLSYLLSDKTYLEFGTNRKAMYPAAAYATSVGYVNVKGFEIGKWFLPSISQLYDIMSSISYGNPASSLQNCDELNQTLAAIGGNNIANNLGAINACNASSNGVIAWRYMPSNMGGVAHRGTSSTGTGYVISCCIYKPE